MKEEKKSLGQSQSMGKRIGNPTRNHSKNRVG
jgi:hypothetical protein